MSDPTMAIASAVGFFAGLAVAALHSQGKRRDRSAKKRATRRWGTPFDNPPIEGLDADGDVTYTFTGAHSWRDVANWIMRTEVDAKIVRELLAKGQNDE